MSDYHMTYWLKTKNNNTLIFYSRANLLLDKTRNIKNYTNWLVSIPPLFWLTFPQRYTKLNKKQNMNNTKNTISIYLSLIYHSVITLIAPKYTKRPKQVYTFNIKMNTEDKSITKKGRKKPTPPLQHILNPKTFVHKLYNEIENNQELIIWNEYDNNRSFIITDINMFTANVLPRLFKHCNYASFVRQLNKYGFNKIKQSDLNPSLLSDPKCNPASNQNNINVFRNDFFQKDRVDLLPNIKRQETPQNSELSKDLTNILQKTLTNAQSEIPNKYALHSDNDVINKVIIKVLKLEKLVQDQFQKQQNKIDFLTQELDSLRKFVGCDATPSRNNSAHGLRDPSDNQPPTLLPGFHILLCEDDDICIQICRKFLEKMDCKITVVNDGISCIQTLKENPSKYDLILMDIIIPQLDGTTATAVIRSMNSNVPIIAMTGNVLEDDLLQYLQNGMTDVLAKPFNRRDLHEMLLRYLANKVPSMSNG